MSEYGRVAIGIDEWLNEHVQPILTHGLPPLPPTPGELRDFNPSLHPHDPRNGRFIDTPGGGFAERLAHALKDAHALDAAPVRLISDHNAGTVTLTGVPESRQRELMLSTLAYQMGMHDSINGVLRGSRVPGDRAGVEKKIHDIDEAMRHSPLSHDVRVFRGIRNGRRFGNDWNGSMVGVRFTEPAYASTTTDRRIADDFMNSGDPAPAVLHVLVPAGTHAINLSGFGEGHNDEAELLLDRGLQYEVIGDSIVNGVRQLDVRVVS